MISRKPTHSTQLSLPKTVLTLLVGFCLAYTSPLLGQTPTYDSSGPVNVFPGNPTLAEPFFQLGVPSTQVPYYLLLKQDPSNPSFTFDLEVQLSGLLQVSGTSSAPLNGSLLEWNSETGSILVNEVGIMDINWTANSVPSSTNQLGIGALSVGGLPSQQNNQGENVTVDLYSGYSISATLQSGLPSFSGTLTTLNPQGLRTAQFNGIIATSYGLQDENANDTAQGGNVQVTTQGGSTITVASDDPTVLTAGISATSASGGGKADGIGTNQIVTVNHGGSIVNTSPLGIGIMAINTGALFTTSGGTLAVSGPVTVNLTDNSSINVTGTTSVGVFAVSEAYTTSDEPKNTTVAGGTVSGTIGAGATITTGSANSNLSIGYLGVSTGTDGLLNPFTSQSVNKTGSGSGGQVNLTNYGLVSTTGTMSIGLAALSTGGAGIATNTDGNSSGYSYVGNSGTVSDGSGDQVTVTNSGTIITIGNSAAGIVAISSGGGGIINNDLAGSSTSGLGIGDNNTSGSDPASNGGAVGVINNGSIQTGTGDGSSAASIGIVAQSIGGSGGTAGGGHTALFAGDKGGGGGTGGTVTVTTGTLSTISTQDFNSVGILAQSIGGGGGNGASAEGLFVAVGGRGGNGGAGGQISIDLGGNITTTADHAAGAIGQSIGGGGGNGGGAKSIGFIFDTGIGGKAGHGGAGDLTQGTLEATGTINTQGNNSAGMILQSVGGGGGTGGAAYAGSAGLLTTVTIAVGGGGGNGGIGGEVTAINKGTITTGVPIPTGSFTGLPTIDGDDSAGIIAQSVGGGGGHAGSAVAKSLDIQAPDVPGTVTFNLSLGGTGGAAGDGGVVSVTNEANLATYGDGSHAIIAQSIGGGGGDGGDSTAASLMLGTSAAEVSTQLTFGGQGGAGGNGNNVEVNNIGAGSNPAAASIFTQGQNAAGILAQSIGGGGGNGGFGTAKAHNVAAGEDSSSYVFTLDMGGKGGNGGTSGIIDSVNTGSIVTQGSGSQGILAQTIGGGGGNSGGGSSSASNNTLTITLNIGANGAHGGDSAQPESIIQNSGIIRTSGGDASGIVAQAIGGGGGNGGSSSDDATIGIIGQVAGQLSNNFTYTSEIAVGGKGGSGGLGGWIDVSNDAGVDENAAKITTAGTRAYGMVGQSIGGGGGIGGAATADANAIYLSPLNRNAAFNASLALGGAGGAGSNGGTVDGLNSGVISTSGFSSHGVVLQSVGGGGGIAADGSLDVHANLSLGVQIGEASGSASSGGTITFLQNGKIETTAADAMGILAQSVGGGGGLGTVGSFFTFPVKGGSVVSIGVNATLGFHLSNSTPSEGGTVTITNGPDTADGRDPLGGVIKTTGDWSHGIVAQSIGAGGGKASTIYGTSTYYYPDLAVQVGGSEGKGNGGTVTGTLAGGSITTGTTLSGTSASGYSAFGYVAQSIGGGGGLFSDGSSTSTGSITLGGTTGVSGNGGATLLTTTGSVAAITTNGYGAHGVILQSIGGGGGIAGTGNSSITDSSIGAGVIVGGNDASGNGGNVTVNNSVLHLATTGKNAYALIAQSIGGGGGIATALNGYGVGNDKLGNLGRLGASNASTDSNGGDVNVTLAGGSQITTSGLASHGLVIQSIGGGGGIANPDIYSGIGGLTPTLAGANDSKALGYGGNVNVDVDADITTTGNGAYGLIAQVIGGGGGIFGNYAGSTGSASSSATGTSNGTITLTQAGSVTASGQNSIGIFAQNTTASHAGNTVSLTINGSVNGALEGIWVADGRNNTVLINSTGTVTSAVGNALLYTGNQTTTVTNFGTVNGSVDLGNTTNTINNKGTFNSGTSVTGEVFNEVLLNPGGAGAATHTTMTGDLDSVTGAILRFDIYSGQNFSPGQNDQILFSSLTFGASLAFNTTIVADFHNNVVLGEQDYLLIGTGDNSFLNDLTGGLQMMNFNPAPGDTFSYGLYIDGNDDSLHLLVDVVPEPSPAWLFLLGGLGLGIAHGYRQRLSRRTDSPRS